MRNGSAAVAKRPPSGMFARPEFRASSVLPGEVATPILEKRPVPPSKEQRALMAQAEDLGQAILFIAPMPASTCVNELIIAPTFNRFYTGGLEVPKS